MDMKTRIAEVFQKQFGGEGAFFASSGRINLIGEHTDYNGGYVFPGAIDKCLMAEIRLNGTDKVRAFSIDCDDYCEFGLEEADKPAALWARYIFGVCRETLKRGGKVEGFDTVLAGDVPLGAGLSSSAALESTYAFAINELFGNKIESFELARIGQSTEHNYCGVNCGIMDQFASVHGKKEVFDEILATHDKYHWDFVQIELNYLDWDYADEISKSNVDASYLYAELQKKGIPAVIMEPLLGGRLANLPNYLAAELKSHAPERSVASWAFRYAGTPEGVLTVLSGMTYMEHLKDNLLSYCPLVPLTEQEQEYLHKEVADRIVGLENIPCNDCKYCMPCPYGIDIPAIFVHYNKCKNEGTLPREKVDAEYAKLRRNYLIGLDRAVPRLRQADHCISCGQCEPHCPQSIRIPRELRKISEFVEELRRSQEA